MQDDIHNKPNLNNNKNTINCFKCNQMHSNYITDVNIIIMMIIISSSISSRHPFILQNKGIISLVKIQSFGGEWPFQGAGLGVVIWRPYPAQNTCHLFSALPTRSKRVFGKLSDNRLRGSTSVAFPVFGWTWRKAAEVWNQGFLSPWRTTFIRDVKATIYIYIPL